MLVMAAGAFAQPTQAPPPVLNSDTILGFETPAGWMVKAPPAIPSVSATATRTQGKLALDVVSTGNPTTLTSLPVASTASALRGLRTGAILNVDVMLAASQSVINSATLKLFVTSHSRGLIQALVGEANFTRLRPNVYGTLGFPVPDGVGDALGGSTFTDLTFEFVLSSPSGDSDDHYLFDNLRVNSVPLVTTNANTRPPAGYGGSVDLEAIGSVPATKLFAAGPVQVPESFNLTQGAVGSTTVHFALGYDGTAALTCTYMPDSSDTSRKSYIFTSCTGGFAPGDLVAANWAQLTIEGGNNLIAMRAQLAKNPLGDQVGTGIIPPIPTFWGETGGCVPAPIRGKVVTMSSSCVSQTSEASQIITTYTNALNNSNTPPNWIVTPVPELAIRQADGSAQPPTNTLTFDDEGHLNPGGDWDAYWRLNGNLTPQAIAGTDRSTTHFDATFGAHAVLWGEDVDVVDVSTAVDTATAQTVPVPIGPSSTGSVHLFLFGTEIPTGGFKTDLRGFNVNESLSQELDLPPVTIWIFSITLGATADVGVTATGGVSNNGLDIVFTPSATLGAHLKGSIDLVVASGGVDAKVNLLAESIPLSAKAQWSFSFDPAVCAASLSSALHGQEQFSSLGGEVDLVATLGFCPLCKNESWTIFKWDPVVSYTADLFNTPESTDNFALPASLCTRPLKVAINTPLPNQTFPASVPVGLAGLAASPNDLKQVPCANYVWKLTPAVATDTVSPLSGSLCNPNVIFSAPTVGATSSWTISLSATNSYSNQFETIVESGSATPVTISISPLGKGDYVTQLTDQNGVVYTPNPAACGFGIDFCLNGNPPQTYTIQGLVNGVSGLPTTRFTVTDSNGNTTALATTNPNSSTPSAVWTPPLTFGLNSGTYTITMQTTVGNGVFASTTSTVFFSVLQ